MEISLYQKVDIETADKKLNLQNDLTVFGVFKKHTALTSVLKFKYTVSKIITLYGCTVAHATPCGFYLFFYISSFYSIQYGYKLIQTSFLLPPLPVLYSYTDQEEIQIKQINNTSPSNYMNH